MGAGANRDARTVDDGGNIVRMRALDFKRDDRALVLAGADDAQRVDLAQALLGVGQETGLMRAMRGLPTELI